jgi:spore germination cell wall hydrolase CwlJ-like protein
MSADTSCDSVAAGIYNRGDVAVKRIYVLALGLCMLFSPLEAAEVYNFGTRNARITALEAADVSSATAQEIVCLSLNIYHEARGTSGENQLAVALVTRNRARLLGKSFCEVVYQRNMVGNRAIGTPQFSWTTKWHSRNLERQPWDQAQQIAWRIVNQHRVVDITQGATHFYERHLRPDWSRSAASRVTIGAHTFVRLPKYEQLAEAR